MLRASLERQYIEHFYNTLGFYNYEISRAIYSSILSIVEEGLIPTRRLTLGRKINSLIDSKNSTFRR